MTDSDLMETATGGWIDPLRPDPDRVHPMDVVHALANMCRFNGHTRRFYSVAQHSIVVADGVTLELEDVRLAALLHDASEAYLCDLTKPVKDRLNEYKVAERLVMRAVARRFRISYSLFYDARVVEADVRALMTERRDLMHGNSPPWGAMTAEPFETKIRPLPSTTVRREYLQELRSALVGTGRVELAAMLEEE